MVSETNISRELRLRPAGRTHIDHVDIFESGQSEVLQDLAPQATCTAAIYQLRRLLRMSSEHT
jgi:hypothetical protein